MRRSVMNLKRQLLRRMPKEEGREVAEAWKSAENIAMPISENVMLSYQRMFLRKENANPVIK